MKWCHQAPCGLDPKLCILLGLLSIAHQILSALPPSMSNHRPPPPAEPSWPTPGHVHTGYSVTLPPLLLLLPVYSQPSSQSDPLRNRSRHARPLLQWPRVLRAKPASLEPREIWPLSALSPFPSTLPPVYALQPHQPCFFLTSRRGFCLLFPLPRTLFSLTPGWLVPSLRVCAQMRPDKRGLCSPTWKHNIPGHPIAGCIFLQSTY